MIKRLFFYSIICFFISPSYSYAQSNQLAIISINKVAYISLNSFIQELNLKSKNFNDNKKVIIFHKTNRVVLSGGSSYFLINDEIFNLYTHVIYDSDEFYIPAKSFIKHLKDQDIFNNIHLDSSEQLLIIKKPKYTISHYNVSEKGNGFSITLNTSKPFNENLIAVWVTDNNWLSLSIPGGVVDSSAIQNIPLKKPIKEIKIVQMKDAVQISFLLQIIPDDFAITTNTDTIIISLFTAQQQNAQKIKEEKQKYLIDTIVLDAGHGGKDPGACVKNCKIQEKNITLSIVKKIGEQLKKSDINVIYTRKEDRFITLNDRTNIANTSNGDVFISIHVNSIDNNSQTKGFETYLLRIGKTADAIKEVEKRENGVINMYEDPSSYQKLSKINAIIIQDANAKQSANLAQTIQKELSTSLNHRLNRGVKQAGFQVLWGVTMPNVLVEVGFITNKDERKNLISQKYQKKIATGIVNAIKIYKKQYETHIIE